MEISKDITGALLKIRRAAIVKAIRHYDALYPKLAPLFPR